VLLAHGAAINAKDKKGRTAINHAKRSGNLKIANFLQAARQKSSRR